MMGKKKLGKYRHQSKLSSIHYSMLWNNLEITIRKAPWKPHHDVFLFAMILWHRTSMKILCADLKPVWNGNAWNLSFVVCKTSNIWFIVKGLYICHHSGLYVTIFDLGQGGWPCEFPRARLILEGPSIETHYKFCKFRRSIRPWCKILQESHCIFRILGPKLFKFSNDIHGKPQIYDTCSIHTAISCSEYLLVSKYFFFTKMGKIFWNIIFSVFHFTKLNWYWWMSCWPFRQRG